MNIFITGGSGFVGGHLIEQLSSAHRVRALARSEKAAEAVTRLGATAVRADLATLKADDLAGIDVVVHAAAHARSWGPHATFVEGNVEGTRHLLEVARLAKVKRFIHISTEALLFDGGDLLDVDEMTPAPRRHRFSYSETKGEAEQLVLAANGPAFTTLALRPRMVWGPRDATVLPELLEAVSAGSFAWLDGGRQLTSTTHVLNVAHAVKLALQAGEGGRAYFIADAGTRTLREFMTALAATRGVQLPSRQMPGWLARWASQLVEGVWSLLAPAKKPPMVSFSVAMFSRSITVKTDRAHRELGYSPVVSVEEGLRALAL
jgi:nucleoside-diphosphate-sugar epimerase